MGDHLEVLVVVVLAVVLEVEDLADPVKPYLYENFPARWFGSVALVCIQPSTNSFLSHDGQMDLWSKSRSNSPDGGSRG